ncbi:hypothetical protein TRVL_01948 [Trypanosoma vivax]|nr:hypothetical protein TRVL_01948 [Trypanosoma vivax]
MWLAMTTRYVMGIRRVGTRTCLPCTHTCCRFNATRDVLTSEECRHLEQELPPRELLVSMRTSDRAPGDESENEVTVPGDSFGIMRNRVAFYKPVPRDLHRCQFAELFPEGCHPLQAINPAILRKLCQEYRATPLEVANALREAQHDINVAVDVISRQKGICAPSYSFGLVALESYAPETFCLVDFGLPSLEATRNDDVLDAIHELTLSAAEMPLDTPSRELVDKFLNTWTTEDGRMCDEVLREHDMVVKDIIMLPYGDYSVQGFHVLNPVKEDTPNIGTGVAACCLDLRTGIHNRFRFHVERIADSISEHVVRELVHFGQDVHLLRQAYWFRPEYSVEEYIRFKESLLQPSASVFEMRYAVLTAGPYGLAGYRNLIEMEKLKIFQHKYEKHYEDFTSPGKWLTSDNAQLQTVAAGGGISPGAAMHMHTNNSHTERTAMETRTGPLRRELETSIQSHGDRVFARFYRNNYH